MAMPDPIMHATCAIADTCRGLSRLPDDVLNLFGLSSPGVRRLLNNLCAFDGCRFLEVGAYHGATAISASYGNSGRFVTIDDFHEFAGRPECEANLAAYADRAPVELIVADAWGVPLEGLAPVDVLWYDGAHDPESQQKAIEHFAPIMAATCVVVVDDWNWPAVRAGTRRARPAIPWYPLARWELFTADLRDSSTFHEDPLWWNGLFVGVYRSKPRR